MADAISIQFPEADRRALFAQMDRARKELGKSLGQALRFAGWALASSLGAATRVASKQRDIFEVSGRRVDRTGWAAKKKFIITSFLGGQPRPFERYANSKSDPEIKKARVVKNRGLAKASWMWGARALGRGAKFKDATAKAKKSAAEAVSVRKDLKSDNPYVELRNRLGYIRAALKGGPSEINSALGKAARHMAHIIDEDIVTKMGAK